VAILDAAAELLRRGNPASVSVDTIAAAAGVGKQTIYRWWPSRGAVLLDAMVRGAQRQPPVADTGTLIDDLEAFLSATFRAASSATTNSLLRGAMAEGLRDRHGAEVLQRFTAARRDVLREILERGQMRGDVPPAVDFDLVIDQVYGLLWYRILIGHTPVTPRDARPLARALVVQLRQSVTSTKQFTQPSIVAQRARGRST
jgi:AcrR family transcriptional regulator